MSGSLWKYATRAHEREFLLSLDLFAPWQWSAEKQLDTLYALSNQVSAQYLPHQIPKKKGGVRQLYEPKPLLKHLQRNLLKNVLATRTVSPYAQAYRQGVPLVANARPHQQQPLVFQMDIQDFFQSIQVSHVRGAAFPARLFPPAVGQLLTELCCLNESLPQGAPTSALISNLVMLPFDRHLGAWCEARGITYTRYCDDLTFSGDFNYRAVETKVTGLLAVFGFEVNQRKTRASFAGARQQVTGLVVNQKVQVSREYRRRVRQASYYCVRYGVAAHLEQTTGQVPSLATQINYLQQLLGQINFIVQVRPEAQEFHALKGALRQLLKEIPRE